MKILPFYMFIFAWAYHNIFYIFGKCTEENKVVADASCCDGLTRMRKSFPHSSPDSALTPWSLPIGSKTIQLQFRTCFSGCPQCERNSFYTEGTKVHFWLNIWEDFEGKICCLGWLGSPDFIRSDTTFNLSTQNVSFLFLFFFSQSSLNFFFCSKLSQKVPVQFNLYSFFFLSSGQHLVSSSHPFRSRRVHSRSQEEPPSASQQSICFIRQGSSNKK